MSYLHQPVRDLLLLALPASPSIIDPFSTHSVLPLPADAILIGPFSTAPCWPSTSQLHRPVLDPLRAGVLDSLCAGPANTPGAVDPFSTRSVLALLARPSFIDLGNVSLLPQFSSLDSSRLA